MLGAEAERKQKGKHGEGALGNKLLPEKPGLCIFCFFFFFAKDRHFGEQKVQASFGQCTYEVRNGDALHPWTLGVPVGFSNRARWRASRDQ